MYRMDIAIVVLLRFSRFSVFGRYSVLLWLTPLRLVSLFFHLAA
jgi:hypothetical protein